MPGGSIGKPACSTRVTDALSRCPRGADGLLFTCAIRGEGRTPPTLPIFRAGPFATLRSAGTFALGAWVHLKFCFPWKNRNLPPHLLVEGQISIEIPASCNTATRNCRKMAKKLQEEVFFMTDPTPCERFKNRKAAWDWLQAEGVAVSRGKFYQDCIAGDILVFKDKTVSRASVLEYARELEAALPIPNATTASLAGVKAELEVEKLRLEVAKLDRAGRAQDREWMRAEDGWMAVAALLGILRDEFSFRAWRLAPELVELVRAHGDGPDLEARVFELIEQKLTGAAFNDLPAEIPEGTYFESISADNAGADTRPEPAKEGTA